MCYPPGPPYIKPLVCRFELCGSCSLSKLSVHAERWTGSTKCSFFPLKRRQGCCARQFLDEGVKPRSDKPRAQKLANAATCASGVGSGVHNNACGRAPKVESLTPCVATVDGWPGSEANLTALQHSSLNQYVAIVRARLSPAKTQLNEETTATCFARTLLTIGLDGFLSLADRSEKKADLSGRIGESYLPMRSTTRSKYS